MVMVIPLALSSPYLSGMTGVIFALSLSGYGLTVYNGAIERNKQSLNLFEMTKRARRDEEKLKDLLFMSSFIIFELDQQLTITDASRAPLYPQVSWHLPADLTKEIQNFQRSHRKNDSFEMNVRLERESTWYQFNLRQDENTIYVVALDINNKKKIELELEEQKASQINNSKLAALGEMAGGIAHEVNNPLTILSGNIFKLKRSLKKDKYTKDDLISSLEKMESTIKRISKIIIGLRNLSHPGHASSEKTNIFDVVEDTVGLCQEKFLSQGVNLINKIQGEDELVVRCGHIEFGQILLNLVNNAFDIIKAQDEKFIYLRMANNDDKENISIEICDNGPGAEDPSKLFNPFYTTKDVGEGTGLGLSLSRKIAESHGGSLNYYRENDLTVFKLTLPLCPNDKPEEEAA